MSESEINKQVAAEFTAAIRKVLASHGLDEDQVGEATKPRIEIQIMKDSALRLYEFAIIVPVTNKELREKWTS